MSVMVLDQYTSFLNVFEQRHSRVGALELMEAFLNLLSFCGLRRGTPAAASNSDNLETSRLAGIGVVFKHAGDYLVVKSLAAEGPAQLSGKVEAGDHIVALGEPGKLRDIKGCDVPQIAKLMLGPPGTSINIKVQRGDAQPFLVELKRGWNTALASSSSYLPNVPADQHLVTAQQSPRGRPATQSN